ACSGQPCPLKWCHCLDCAGSSGTVRLLRASSCPASLRQTPLCPSRKGRPLLLGVLGYCCSAYVEGTQPARTFSRSLPSVSPWLNQAITVRQLRTSSAHPPGGNTGDRHPRGRRR